MKFSEYRGQEFGLNALCAAASVLLSGAPKPQDKRINPLPDPRTVRFYQSAQLVDRPSRYEGRRAIYGYRQLLQTCAVKLLQGAGRGLDEIQRGLAGRSDAELERVLQGPLRLTSSAPDERPQPRPWTSVELTPGVVLSIDPALHPNPKELMKRLHAALSSTPLSSESE